GGSFRVEGRARRYVPPPFGRATSTQTIRGADRSGQKVSDQKREGGPRRRARRRFSLRVFHQRRRVLAIDDLVAAALDGGDRVLMREDVEGFVLHRVEDGVADDGGFEAAGDQGFD